MEKEYFELINEFDIIHELDIKGTAARVALKGVDAMNKLPRPVKSAIGTGINAGGAALNSIGKGIMNLNHSYVGNKLSKYLSASSTVDKYRALHNLGRYHLGRILGKAGLNRYKKSAGTTIDTLHKHIDNIENHPIFGKASEHIYRSARDEALNDLKNNSEKKPLTGEQAHRKLSTYNFFNDRYGDKLNNKRNDLLQGHEPTQKMHILDRKYDPDKDPMFADLKSKNKATRIGKGYDFLTMDWDNPDHKRLRLYHDIKNLKKHQDLKNLPDHIGKDKYDSVMRAAGSVPYEQRIKTSEEFGFKPKQANLPGME
jgi:hypothetical protein